MYEDIVGQPYAVTTLTNAVAENTVSGSYLFVGPDGVGKMTVALRFAAALCGASSMDDPIAKAIIAGRYLDVRSVAPPASSPIISIAQIWPRNHDTHKAENAMLRDLHFEPMVGKKRIFIVQDAEGLGKGSADSGNSILKTLEEPPEYAHFILTATSTSSLMPTIVSRCQVIHFGLLPTADMERVLTSRWELPPERAHFLASYSEGRLGRAVALSRAPSLLAGRDDLMDLAHNLTLAQPIASFKLGEEFRKLASKLQAPDDDDADEGDGKEKKGRAPILRALDLLAGYYRDLLALALIGRGANLINIDRLEQLAADAARYRPRQLEWCLELILSIRGTIERNANAQLALEVLFTHLTSVKEMVPAE